MLATPSSLLYRLRTPEETEAWERFVDLYSPLLFQWARRLGEQESNCADLVQDVFLILWRKLPEFDYDSNRSFHAWLKTIFVNCFRSRKRKRTVLAIDVNDDDFRAAAVTELSAIEDQGFLIRQAFRLIEAEFSELHQRVFRMYVMEEVPPERVAHALQISPGTVYAIKSRILNRLRQELQHLFD